jgi:hypothetical protein
LTTTGFEKITVLTLNPPILLTNVLSSNKHYCLSRRASSASAKATALAAAVTTLSNATGKMLNDPDVIVSYSAFQAEAAINRLIPIDSRIEFPNQRPCSLRIDNLERQLFKLKFLICVEKQISDPAAGTADRIRTRHDPEPEAAKSSTRSRSPRPQSDEATAEAASSKAIEEAGETREATADKNSIPDRKREEFPAALVPEIIRATPAGVRKASAGHRRDKVIGRATEDTGVTESSEEEEAQVPAAEVDLGPASTATGARAAPTRRCVTTKRVRPSATTTTAAAVEAATGTAILLIAENSITVS